jgi:hypothetical protein
MYRERERERERESSLTFLMAERHTAVHAPSTLSSKLLLVNWCVDLLEVSNTLADIAVGRSAALVLDETTSLAAEHSSSEMMCTSTLENTFHATYLMHELAA